MGRAAGKGLPALPALRSRVGRGRSPFRPTNKRLTSAAGRGRSPFRPVCAYSAILSPSTASFSEGGGVLKLCAKPTERVLTRPTSLLETSAQMPRFRVSSVLTQFLSFIPIALILSHIPRGMSTPFFQLSSKPRSWLSGNRRRRYMTQSRALGNLKRFRTGASALLSPSRKEADLDYFFRISRILSA